MKRPNFLKLDVGEIDPLHLSKRVVQSKFLTEVNRLNEHFDKIVLEFLLTDVNILDTACYYNFQVIVIV